MPCLTLCGGCGCRKPATARGAGITAAAGLDSVQIAALATVAVRAAKVALAVMAAAATPALQARLPLQRWYWQQTVSIQSPPSAHCTEATGHTAAMCG
mmetsp:Transcript_110705/g.220086  ORF Transcript_110705/g.220086 Transcript_110705/m.220086 type:complete len:98 (+) Transcript_110705:1271-1564(+)